MGPKGIEEIGQVIMQKSQYLIKKLSDIRDVQSPKLNSIYFKEFVVDFNETGKTVEQINKELLDKNIFGGKDLSKEFPELGQSALYCVTEIHTQEDLDALAAALKEVLN
jgi:glycine dehydrogenase subunit 1